MKHLFPFLYFLFLTACNTSESKLQYGAVTSASPEATQAGLAILKKGGNAADAAIAVSFALSVAEPAMSGIGGGTQVQIHLPNKPLPFSINGSTLSPALTPIIWEKDSLKGHLRTTIPSTVKVLQHLYEHYGSKKLTWATLLEPAIQIAEKGFPMGNFRMKVYHRYEKKLAKGLPSTAEYYPLLEQNEATQNKIATTLRLLAKEGGDAFYKGAIAQSIAKDMQVHGAWMTKEDLVNFSIPAALPSVHFQHNGYDVYTQPEPCGGWVVKEILEKLTALRAANDKEDEVEKLVMAIAYGHQQRQLRAKEKKGSSTTGETTHFSVIDADGMALSVTASINAYYGAGVANPEYGFLYNSYMDDFNFKELDNKYALGPNKMAYSSMSPSIIMKDGKVVLVIGSPGSARIISSVAQLIDKYTRGLANPAKLLELPRVHAINKKVYFEKAEVAVRFKNKDEWKIIEPSKNLVQNGLNAYFGGVHAIVWTADGYIALADPRRDGMAVVE
jgi:gamma-glutamyltranspeptidase/glutathione hydrolase